MRPKPIRHSSVTSHNVLSVSHLTKDYATTAGTIRVLEDVSF